MAAPYRPTEAIQLLRPYLRLSHAHHLPTRTFSTSRPAKATHTTSSTSNTNPPPGIPRKQVTVLNDSGRVRWNDLSVGEKAARTTQQSFNLAVVVAGIVATGAVGFLLFTDVFSTDSKTAHFNRATTRIRSDPKCIALLGPGNQISAHGEASWSRWARNRFIQSTTETDKWGTEHFRFRFYVEGPLNQGVVHVHLQRRPSQSEYEYVVLAVDVKGHQRYYLENAEERKGGKVAPKIFGARWW
ncbi:TIM21-domain-containing protein [Lophiotrema nucula]|uniref:Mitochondrial import inner membrane translocase subunit Tim21 n=1 Tax=Lophiotrema nucula TaxID=690887 RepID=A0A6A5Z341_9PLEO|nr:TIM21-domain-containing protein [Lophiotrema nucula]